MQSAEQMVASARGGFSDSKAREGRESGFATDELHRNREKDPFLAPAAMRLSLHAFPQNQKMLSAGRASLAPPDRIRWFNGEKTNAGYKRYGEGYSRCTRTEVNDVVSR